MAVEDLGVLGISRLGGLTTRPFRVFLRVRVSDSSCSITLENSSTVLSIASSFDFRFLGGDLTIVGFSTAMLSSIVPSETVSSGVSGVIISGCSTGLGTDPGLKENRTDFLGGASAFSADFKIGLGISIW